MRSARARSSPPPSARSARSREGGRDGRRRSSLRRPERRSALRAGTTLNAASWQTEAPLRMLLNNLDPEVAEHPERLVVYGGTGRAARSHDALKEIVRTLLRLRGDETLLVQSGKPVAVFRTGEWAPRVLIANSLLVPRWATWSEFRRLEAEGLTMFGQMTAGSWIYIGTQGILQGTYQTFAAAGEQHFGSPDLTGRTILTAGLGGNGRRAAACGDDGGCVDPLRRGRSEPDRAAAGDAVPGRGGGLARRRARASSRRSGVGGGGLGGPARECRNRVSGARRPWRALRSRDGPDRGARSAHRLRAGRGAFRGGGCAARARSGLVPTSRPGVDRGARPRRWASSSEQGATFSIMATT